MFHELKEVKYFKETTDFKRLKERKRLKSSKSRGVFRTQASIYDETSL